MQLHKIDNAHLKNSAVQTIYWFMEGEKPVLKNLPNWVKKYKNKPTKKAVKKELPKLWTIDELVIEANSALEALSKKSPKNWVSSARNNPIVATRSDWENLRFIGPFIMNEHYSANRIAVKMELGLPYIGMIGLNAAKDKRKNYANYIFVAFKRLIGCPSFINPIKPGILYEAIQIGIFNNDSLAIRFYYTIANDGKVHPCNQLVTETTGYPVRRQHVTWKTQNPKLDSGMEISEALTLAINFYQQIDANFYVTIRNKLGAVNMPITGFDAKHLFKDRVTALARDGKRKRILHWVSSHIRSSKSPVKTHLRGERSFMWNGNHVDISLPGKHGPLFQDIHIVEKVRVEKMPWWVIGDTMKKHWSDHIDRKWEKEDKADGVKTYTDTITGESFKAIPCKNEKTLMNM